MEPAKHGRRKSAEQATILGAERPFTLYAFAHGSTLRARGDRDGYETSDR